MKKLLIILVGIGLISAAGFAYYQFNRSHDDMESQKAVAKMSAGDLFDEYDMDEAASNQKYLGKVIEINGTIFSIDEGSQNDYNILLMEQSQMFGISCNISKTNYVQNLNAGQTISIKGECAGMLSDVVLIRCIIINK